MFQPFNLGPSSPGQRRISPAAAEAFYMMLAFTMSHEVHVLDVLNFHEFFKAGLQ